MSTATELFSQAMGLPAEQREELAFLLWESLPENGRPLVLEPEYEEEVLRRDKEMESGQATTMTLEEVMATLPRPSNSPSTP